MIEICFCTIAFQKNKWGADRTVEVPLEQIWPVLAEAGYDAVELWWPHLEAFAPEARGQLSTALREAGLAVAMVSPYFDFTTSDATARTSLELGHRVVEAARDVGARGVRCFTGKAGSADADESQWLRAVTGLRGLADAAPDLTWALETHAHNLMDTVESTAQLVERIDRPNIGLIFQPSTFMDDALAALYRLGPWIHHVHATNRREGERALLGEGDLDYPAIIVALREVGFKGCISVEWMGEDPATVAQQEARYLRGIL